MGGILSAAAIGGKLLTVTISPPRASAGGDGGHVPAITAIAAGGSGGYAFLWEVVTPDPKYALTINSPHSSSTDFDFAPVASGETATAQVRVTVTSGGQAVTASASVTFSNNISGGSGGSIGLPGGGGVKL